MITGEDISSLICDEILPGTTEGTDYVQAVIGLTGINLN